MSAPHSFRWAKLPTRWVRLENGLDSFRQGDLGVSIAALKLLFAIVGSQHLQRRAGSITSGSKLSYHELTSMTGVARGLISKALSVLAPVVDVQRGEGRATNIYRIKNIEEPGSWAKFPAEHVFKHNILQLFSLRSRTDLGALKLYYLLLAFRRNESGFTHLSYERAVEYGLSSRQAVSRGKSKLIEVGLITVYSTDELLPSGRSRGATRKIYFPLGLGYPRPSDLDLQPSPLFTAEAAIDFS